MFVFRGIATTHVPARQTHPQVHPVISELHAFLAVVNVGTENSYAIEMRARNRHRCLPSERMFAVFMLNGDPMMRREFFDADSPPESAYSTAAKASTALIRPGVSTCSRCGASAARV